MSTANKNKLDELFKNGLNLPDGQLEYNEADWDNLNRQLGKGKRNGVVFWLPYLSAVAAVLLLFIGWWFSKPERVKEQPGMVKNQPDTAGNKPLIVQNDQANNSITSTQSAQKKKVTGDAGIHVNEQAPTQTIDNQRLAQNNQATLQPVKQIKATNNGKNTAAIKNTMIVQQPVNNVLIADNTKINEPATVHTEKTEPATNVTLSNPVQQQTLPTGVQGDATAQNTITKTAEAGTTQEPAVSQSTIKNGDGMPAMRRGPKLALTVLVSPDVNGVGSFKQTEWGQNVGLLLSAGFGKKFTISTGVGYSKKPYAVAFSQYVSTYKFKTDPQNVIADCRVLDIPLNVDYKLYNKGKNAFSVGTGLSSYFMLRETYRYDYGPGAYSGPADYTVSNKNRHILGVLNLNTTYQRQINNKFSVGVQPYLKIPLTDIGNSQVRLQSAGVAVGVSWNINSKNP